MSSGLSDISSTTYRLREPRAFVVEDTSLANTKIDWSSWYLTEEEDMGEGFEQTQIIQTLLSSLSQLAAERNWQNTIYSADQFFAWIEDEPLVRVSPDVYLLDDPPPPPRPSMWETWRPGHHPPRFAVEITSQDWAKDYRQNPPKYAQLGTSELVIVDPEARFKQKNRSLRVPLQIYRRDPDDAFVKVYAGEGPAFSQELDAWLVVVPLEGTTRLRIARDSQGKDLIPTAEENAIIEREKVREERNRAEAAEARNRELLAELTRLKNK